MNMLSSGLRAALLGGGAATGALDGLDNLYGVYSAQRVLTIYPLSSPIYKIRRDSDDAELDIYPRANGWPSIADIESWLAGANAYVRTIYDQSGNSRHVGTATHSAQPTLDVTGANPTFGFDGVAQGIDVTAQLAAFSQNQTACSLVCVRKNATTSTAADRFTIFVGNGTTSTRMAIGILKVSAKDGAQGRRLDADSIARTTGFTPDTNWATQIARFDWSNAILKYQRSAEAETKDPFQTAGSTSNTASVYVGLGRDSSGAAIFAGNVTLFAFVRDYLTDAEVAGLVA